MGNFYCKECEREFTSYPTYSRHNGKIHNIKSETTYVNTFYNGINPTCQCGCGTKVKFLTNTKGFREFVSGHNSTIKGSNNFHKDPETKIKSAKTQSDNWKKGMYRRWWEEDTEDTRNKIEGIKEKLRTNKERGLKISKTLKGVSKTEESKRKLSITQKQRYIDNPNLKVKLSELRLKWMRDNRKVKTSKLETTFKSIIESLGFIQDIDYEHSYLIIKIKTFFDFYFIEKNILIEVDGDYYHCNPDTKFKEPKYPMQFKNISNDKRKSSWCKNHNIPLYRFWEKDINERPEWVKEELRKILL